MSYLVIADFTLHQGVDFRPHLCVSSRRIVALPGLTRPLTANRLGTAKVD